MLIRLKKLFEWKIWREMCIIPKINVIETKRIRKLQSNSFLKLKLYFMCDWWISQEVNGMDTWEHMWNLCGMMCSLRRSYESIIGGRLSKLIVIIMSKNDINIKFIKCYLRSAKWLFTLFNLMMVFHNVRFKLRSNVHLFIYFWWSIILKIN